MQSLSNPVQEGLSLASHRSDASRSRQEQE